MRTIYVTTKYHECRIYTHPDLDPDDSIEMYPSISRLLHEIMGRYGDLIKVRLSDTPIPGVDAPSRRWVAVYREYLSSIVYLDGKTDLNITLCRDGLNRLFGCVPQNIHYSIE